MMSGTHVHTRPRVAIVIPVCNEQGGLQTLRIRLADLQRSLQSRFVVFYLFVDDGSTDRTAELLPRVVPKGASHRVISHAKNLGLGEAFRTGFRAVESADIVCTIDADCSYRADGLVPMIDLIAGGKADVVVASPYHPQGGVDGVSVWRLTLSRLCSMSYRLVSPLSLYTYTSMFRAYRGSFIRKARFRSNGFVSTVELLMSASCLGYRIHEMPVVLHRRVAGASKMRIAHTIGQHLRLLFHCLMAGPNRYPLFCHEAQTSQTDKNGDDASTFVSMAPHSRKELAH